MSDFYPHGRVANAYGVLRPEGYSERALFVIDKRGVVRYVDVHDIDEQPDNEVLFDVLGELEPQAAGFRRGPEAGAKSARAPKGGVTLYCTRWCPACYRARAYLEQRGIPYVEVDITSDKKAAQRVRNWAGGVETTPTFEIDGTVIVDFNETRLNELFGLK